MRTLAILLLAGAALAVDLPSDPSAVVLTYDEVGGYGPERTRKAPFLSVLADGTVRVVPFGKDDGDIELKLSKDELKGLMEFVVEKHRFFEFDEKKAAASIGRGNPGVVDASSTVISCRTKDKSATARFYALAFAARRNPKARAVQDLYAIQMRLINLMAIVRAGGQKKAAELLALANAELKRAYPKVQPLVVADLVSTGRYPDGALYLRFHRYEGPASYTAAFVRVPGKGKPKVEVSVKSK